MVGIFYLVGNRHLLEVTFTFAMTVEVETNAGNSSCLQLVSNTKFQTTIPVACETVAKDNNRALFRQHIGRLQIGHKLPMVALNDDSLRFGTCKTCQEQAGKKYQSFHKLQVLYQLLKLLLRSLGLLFVNLGRNDTSALYAPVAADVVVLADGTSIDTWRIG